jgi:hypothetical protein
MLGFILPFLVQRVKESARVPVVASVALGVAVVAGIMSQTIIGGQVPYLAWELFTALAAGYTVAKIPGTVASKVVASIAIALVACGVAMYAPRALAQDGTVTAPPLPPDGGLGDIAIVIISGLLGRLSKWIATKIRKH